MDKRQLLACRSREHLTHINQAGDDSFPTLTRPVSPIEKPTRPMPVYVLPSKTRPHWTVGSVSALARVQRGM